MALEFQIQTAPFRFGIEEGIDPKQVPIGTLLTCQNMVWRKSGRLQKRNGTLAPLTRNIHGGGAISAGSRLFSRGGELCLIDGTFLYTYSDALTQWVNQGNVTESMPTWKTSLDPVSGISACDSAESGNFTLQAWVTGDPSLGSTNGGGATALTQGKLYYQILNRKTGAVIEGPTSHAANVSTFFGCRWVVIGTNAFLVSENGVNIVVLKFDLSSTTQFFVSATNVRTDSNARGFDAVTIGDSLLIIAYENNVNALKLYSYNTALVQQATGGVTGEAGTVFNNISIDGLTGREIYVAYSVDSSSKVRVALCDPSTLAQTVAPVDVVTATTANHVGILRVDATQAILVYDEMNGAASTGQATAKSFQVSNAGVVSATIQRTLFGGMWVSRPFLQGGKAYGFVCGPWNVTSALTSGQKLNGLYTALVECELTPFRTAGQPPRYVARVETLLGAYYTRGQLAKVTQVTATEYAASLLFLGDAPAERGVDAVFLRTGIRRISILQGAALPQDMWRVSFDKEAYLSGGYLHAYDGRTVFDYGFASAPIFQGYSAGGAGNIGAGSYLYAWHHEFRSAAGMRHRSPVAIAGTPVVLAAGVTNPVNVCGSNLSAYTKLKWNTGGPTLDVNTVASPVLNVIHRTVAGGSTLYRLTYEPKFQILYNDPTLITQQLVDNAADTNIGNTVALNTRPQLYTAGDVLHDYQPPASMTVLRHRDRLFLIDGSQRELWFSKSFQDDIGTVPGFHPDFRNVFDRPLTSLASMDERLFIFAADAIWMLSGDGPAPNEANSDFGVPVRLQARSGCTNPRSITADGSGLYYQSGSDLNFLNRSLESEWLGKPARDTLAAFPVITSALNMPNDKQIRFSCNNAAGTSGVVLVYSTSEKQWSTLRYLDPNTGNASTPIADACLQNGVYTFVTPGGTVIQEDATQSLDAGTTWVPILLETAWWHAQGPLAYHAVSEFRLDGISVSNHQLLISAGFNGDPAYGQGPNTWLDLVAGVTTVGPIEHASFVVGNRRKCRSIRFKIEDLPPLNSPVGTGQGPIFDMMGIEVGVKKGLGKIHPATKRG